MNKKIIVIFILLFTTISLFSFFYEEIYKRALELSWEGKFDEAEKIYKDLIPRYKTKDIIISYSNLLGWQARYDEAIKLLKDFDENDNDIRAAIAKVYFWKEDFDTAYSIYKFLLNMNYPLEENIIDFIVAYESDDFVPGQNYDEKLLEALEFSRIGIYDEAEKLFLELLEEFRTKELIIAYSNLLAWQGFYNKALEVVILFEDQSDIEIIEQLAKIYFWKENFDKAYKHYYLLKTKEIFIEESIKEFMNWYEKNVKPYDNFEGALKKAADLSSKKMYIDAEKIYNGLMPYYSNNKDFIIAYADLFINQNNYFFAIAVLEYYQEDDIEVLLKLANAYYITKNYDKAYEYYSYLKTKNYTPNKEINDLIRWYETFMNFYSGYDEAFAIALENSRTGNYSKAEEILENLIIYYKSKELVIALSDIYAWQKKYDKALNTLNKFPSFDIDIKINTAKIYQWSEDLENAYKTYKEIQNLGYNLDEDILYFINMYERFKEFSLSGFYFTNLYANIFDDESFLISDLSLNLGYKNIEGLSAGLNLDISLKNYEPDRYFLGSFIYFKNGLSLHLATGTIQNYVLQFSQNFNKFQLNYKNVLFRNNELSTINFFDRMLHEFSTSVYFNISNFLFEIKPSVSLIKETFDYNYMIGLNYDESINLKIYGDFETITTVLSDLNIKVNDFEIKIAAKYNFQKNTSLENFYDFLHNFYVGFGVSYNFNLPF